MWILPADLSGLHIELTAGPHLLPWYYSEDELDRLSWLLRLTVKGIRAELRLDDAMLKMLSDRHVTISDALVVASVREISPGIDEVSERLRALGARCALLQFPDPQELGYGWLEREVKAPLYKLIVAWVKQPEHPLATFNIPLLPVLEAAALTTDPVELIDLLERTTTHRTRYADIGVCDEDYRRSLLLSAGERLAGRLQKLDKDSLRVAKEVLLSDGHNLDNNDQLRAGAMALERVGLARRIGGDTKLGPLARGLQEPTMTMLGAFESQMPGDIWTAEDRRQLEALQGSRVEMPVVQPTACTTDLWGIHLWLKDLREFVVMVFPAEAAAIDSVELLQDLANVPRFVAAFPDDRQNRLVTVQRWLDVSLDTSDIRRRHTARLISGLLYLLEAHGADARTIQERALQTIDAAFDRLSVPWAVQVRTAAQAWTAEGMIREPRREDDLSTAAELLHRCMEVWTDPANRAAGHLLLGQVAVYREDYDRAREHYDHALQRATAIQDHHKIAAVHLALARGAFVQSHFGEAERHAQNALKLSEVIGDRHGASCAQVIVAASFTNQKKYTEAENLLEAALATAKQLGDVAEQVECMVFLCGVWIALGKRDAAEKLAAEAAALAERVDLPLSRALAYSIWGTIYLLRGALDESFKLHGRAVEQYELVGAHPKLSAAMRAAIAKIPVDSANWNLLGPLFRAASDIAFPRPTST